MSPNKALSVTVKENIFKNYSTATIGTPEKYWSFFFNLDIFNLLVNWKLYTLIRISREKEGAIVTSGNVLYVYIWINVLCFNLSLQILILTSIFLCLRESINFHWKRLFFKDFAFIFREIVFWGLTFGKSCFVNKSRDIIMFFGAFCCVFYKIM